MNPLYQLGNSPLLSSVLPNEDQPSSAELKRSCFQKKTPSRKQLHVKIRERLVDGETLWQQETPLRTAVCPVITTCKKTTQICHRADARVKAGEGTWLLGEEETGGMGRHVPSSLSSIFATIFLCSTTLFWFLHHNRINLVFFGLPLNSSCVMIIYWIFFCSKGLKWFLNDWQGLSVASKSDLRVPGELQLQCCSSAGWSFLFHLEKALDLSKRCLALKETEL